VIRLHLDADLAPGALLPLDVKSLHYLQNVMRLREGAQILVFNGRHGEWAAVLEGGGKRGGALRVGARRRPQPPPQRLELMIALIKRQRLDGVVEKAVELGVGTISLLLTRRTNADHVNLERLAAIAREAAEQTGRLDAPRIRPPRRLEEAVRDLEPGARLIFCDEAGDDPLEDWGGPLGRAPPLLEVLGADARALHGPWSILIGPEGGFAPEERQLLRDHAAVLAVSLGPRILRADTAAFAALALWQSVLGDWRLDADAAAAAHERP
jgi:16S rRNA (uracil1498-N3)-methyltransferase